MSICKCRICGNKKIHEILNLGNQYLTGVFPLPEETIGDGILRLVKCDGDTGCGLVQLDRSFDSKMMYGENYGYRSSLNNSMKDHLLSIVKMVNGYISLRDHDLVVDIGSNDGTLLNLYSQITDKKIDRVGIDPTSLKFKQYYEDGITIIPTFFSKDALGLVTDKKAKVISSIAMFYDLENPIQFAQNVVDSLDDQGIWVMEQSYLPAMVDTCSYDTICHEHIEYYSFKQIRWIAEKVGLKILYVNENDINGGSFMVILAKKESAYVVNKSVDDIIQYEIDRKIDSVDFFDDFTSRINICKEQILSFLQEQKKKKKLVLGYGASTKGNVVLQYCGINEQLLPAIAEVNADKFGHVTPGTKIPIISENEAKNIKPDFFFVLPWHFKKNILEKEETYMKENGCSFVFLLPEFEIVSK